MSHETKPYHIENNTLYFSNNYNSQLTTEHMKLILQVKHLHFGNEFNQPFTISPNIISVTTGNDFNKPFVSTPNIESITFGYGFNRVLILTPNVLYLKLKNCMKPMTLNKKLLYLENGFNYSQKTTLNKFLEKLYFGDEFYHPITLNYYLNILSLGAMFNHYLILTKKLHCVIFGREYNQIISPNKKLLEISFGYRFNQNIKLPKHLIFLKINGQFNKPILLTPNIRQLNISTIFYDFNFLIECSNVWLDICLNSSNGDVKILDNLPNNSRYFKLNWSTPKCNNLPNKAIIVNKFPTKTLA